MFHAKRERQDQGADNPTNASTAAQSAPGQPTEHLPRNSSPGQPVTVHRRTAGGNIFVRPGLILLALAAVTGLGGVLVATASATPQDMGGRQAEHASAAVGLPVSPVQTTETTQPYQTRDQPPLIPAQTVVQLVLDPDPATILQDERQAYTAWGFARDGKPLGAVTTQTRFTIDSPGVCEGAVCTSAQPGDYTVT